MTPLADTHVHLLAGLDDGPRDPGEADAMCRMLVAEGVRHATALAHQNESYPENTAARLRTEAAALTARLQEKDIALSVYPTGEIILTPDLLEDWQAGKLLSYGDRGKYLLVEMPHGVTIDLRPLASNFRAAGVNFVLAHAERYLDMLEEPGVVESFIASGCLIQVTASALAAPNSAAQERTLKDWTKRGIIHLLGSDGHRIDRREPRMKAGYEVLAKWGGRSVADRIGGIWGAAVLQGSPIHIPIPAPRTRSWFSRLLNG